MSEQRQFCPQLEGGTVGAGDAHGQWDQATGYGGLGECYFVSTPLDLRGLMAGNEQGLFFNSISLQESRPWSVPVAEGVEQGWFMVYDMLTTVPLTMHTIAECFVRPDTGTSVCPGFLFPMNTLANEWPETEQTLNPSQIIWGVWRLFCNNMSFKLPETFGLGMSVLQSGYFGQGDYAVSPSLYYTRIVCTAAPADVIVVPSANLLTNARAEPITAPMEISQMMRAAQR